MQYNTDFFSAVHSLSAVFNYLFPKTMFKQRVYKILKIVRDAKKLEEEQSKIQNY